MYRLRLTLHFLTLDVITHSERLYNWIGAHYKSFEISQSDLSTKRKVILFKSRILRARRS